MNLGTLLDGQAVNGDEVRRHVEGLSSGDGRDQCLTLDAAQQRRLWQLTSIDARRSHGELVLASRAVFAGRNSLRLLRRFEKWFARQGGVIVGCNRHVLSPLIGPGYFTVREGQGCDLEFDYAAVPGAPPSGWPPVRANNAGLARPVYADLTDRVVWLSSEVLIGAAFRGGKPLDSYFVLVRSL